MRKLLHFLVMFCFMGSLALAGITPSSTSPALAAPPSPIQAHAAMAANGGQDCDHHAPEELPDHAKKGHTKKQQTKMDCCAAGYCPVMAQGMLPDDTLQFAFDKAVPYALTPEIQRGLVRLPSLRPPRPLI